MCVEFWWLRKPWHHFHNYQTIRRPLVSPRWVLKKTISNRIEKVHQRIKVITRNNCVLIRADPHSKGGHRGCSNRASDLPERRGQGFSFNYYPSAHCTLCLGSSWTFNTCSVYPCTDYMAVFISFWSIYSMLGLFSCRKFTLSCFIAACCCSFVLLAHFVVFHVFIPTFLFVKIVSFIIFNMAHLSSSYLLYSFFFSSGFWALMIPTGSIKVWSHFNFSFEISGWNSIRNFMWFSDAAL